MDYSERSSIVDYRNKFLKETTDDRPQKRAIIRRLKPKSNFCMNPKCSNMNLLWMRKMRNRFFGVENRCGWNTSRDKFLLVKKIRFLAPQQQFPATK